MLILTPTNPPTVLCVRNHNVMTLGGILRINSGPEKTVEQS